MAHSILDENGHLVDITPMDPGTPREALAFLKHLGAEEDFSGGLLSEAVSVGDKFLNKMNALAGR